MPRPDDMRPDEPLAMLLHTVDHPVPVIAVENVIGRARRRARRHLWLGATMAFLVTGVAVAGATVPPSVVVRYVQAVFAHGRTRSAPRSTTTSSPSATAPAQAVRGVSFVPGNRVDVAFRERQATGVLRVRIADVPAVRLSHDRSVASYTLTTTGVDVDNAGSSASYELVIPQHVMLAHVVVGARAVLTKDADHVTSTGIRDASGEYVIAIQDTNARRP